MVLAPNMNELIAMEAIVLWYLSIELRLQPTRGNSQGSPQFNYYRSEVVGYHQTNCDNYMYKTIPTRTDLV